MIPISRTVTPLAYYGVTQVTTYPQYFAVQFINNVGNAMGGAVMFALGVQEPKNTIRQISVED